MSWVDASASAAATINPISTINAANTINFGNGTIETPTSNTVTPTTSTSAVAALGTAGDDAGVGGTSAAADSGYSATDFLVIGGIGLLATIIGGLIVYAILRKK